jgi:hypothetical protein
VHGANRLGANSLLDIVVFGRACAHHIKDTLTPGKPHKAIPEDAGMQSIDYLDEIRLAAICCSCRLPTHRTIGTQMDPFIHLKYVLTCRRPCNRMQLSSGRDPAS